MRAVFVCAAMLALSPLSASAQTPADVQAAIGRGEHPACEMSIASRETGGTFDPYAVNPTTGAVTEFQFLQHGGVWDETPLGRDGYAPTDVSVAQRVAMVDWLIDHGLLYVGWGGC